MATITDFLALIILWLDCFFRIKKYRLCFKKKAGRKKTFNWLSKMKSQVELLTWLDAALLADNLYYLLSNSIKLWLTLIGELLTKLLSDARIEQLLQSNFIINILLYSYYLIFHWKSRKRWEIIKDYTRSSRIFIGKQTVILRNGGY